MTKKKEWSELTRKEKRSGIVSLVVLGFIVIAIISATTSGSDDRDIKTEDSATQTNSTQDTEQTTQTKPDIKERKVVGSKITLSTGTYVVGEDIEPGLYDVSTVSGESGNFMVNGAHSYNEILGDSGYGGVLKIRVDIADGDSIKISGLSKVTFTPVSAKFITSYQEIDLYAGTFTVGEDIGAGRYVITPEPGESGNFFVSGSTYENEILGSDYGVPSLTTTVKDGDVITISSMNTVHFAPTS